MIQYYPPDFIVFIYENPVLKRTDFLIFKAAVLKECLAKVPIKPDKSGYYKLLLWIFPGDFVFIGKQYFPAKENGICLVVWPMEAIVIVAWRKDTERDLSGYLNRWDYLRNLKVFKRKDMNFEYCL